MTLGALDSGNTKELGYNRSGLNYRSIGELETSGSCSVLRFLVAGLTGSLDLDDDKRRCFSYFLRCPTFHI